MKNFPAKNELIVKAGNNSVRKSMLVFYFTKNFKFITIVTNSTIV